MLGVNTNDGDEITTALRLICTRPATAGSCVITIDHLPKSTEARTTGYAIGSIAKKRMIRGSYLRAEVRVQPAPGGSGITLRIEKDTAGELRKRQRRRLRRHPHPRLHPTPHHHLVHRPRRDAQERRRHLPAHRPHGEAVSRYIETTTSAPSATSRTPSPARTSGSATPSSILVDEGFVSVHAGARNSQAPPLHRPTERPKMTNHGRALAVRPLWGTPCRVLGALSERSAVWEQADVGPACVSDARRFLAWCPGGR
jgi:hypothetical protein